MPMSSDPPPTRFNSYVDYMSYLLPSYPEYAWLSTFLAHPGARPSETHVQITDSLPSGLRHQFFSGQPISTLEHILDKRPPDAQTRIIHVAHTQSWSLDRDVLDVIGLRFMVDPGFFYGHLNHFYACEDRICPRRSRNVRLLWVKPLPSEQTVLEVLCGGNTFRATVLGEKEDGCTVIIFSRNSLQSQSPLSTLQNHAFNPADFQYLPGLLQDKPCARFNALLSRLTPDDIQSANQRPIEYLYPYVSTLARELNTRIQTLAFTLESQFTFFAAALADTNTLEGGWKTLHRIQSDTSSSVASLRAFALASSGPSTKLDILLRDYDDLLRQVNDVQQDLREYLTRHVGMMSLLESRAGVVTSAANVEQAESIGRLTRLAFVFVPLGFVTSFFGMNFAELATGKVKMWVFWVVAFVLAALVEVVAWASSGRRDGFLGLVDWDRVAGGWKWEGAGRV